MRIFAPALLAALLPLTAAAQAPATIQMDKSFIRFVSKQMNVAVEGKFKKFTANLSYDAKKPEASKAEFEVELGSIDLGTPDADAEVKRKTWFNTDAFPKAKFVSTSVKGLGSDRIEVTGPLTIKGTSINITTVATVKTDAAGVSVAEGKFPLKRLAYKIGEGQWADTDTVADEVEVRYRFTFSSKK